MKKTTDYLLADFQGLGNTEPIKQAFIYATKNKQSEVCGLFCFKNSQTDYEFIQLPNNDKLNSNHFTTDNKIFYKHYFNKNVISLFHSHTIDSADLSDVDKAISNSLGLPSYVFSPSSRNSRLYYPQSYKPRKLENRIFIPFFQDCVSFVKDFYSIHLNIDLSKQIHDWSRSEINCNDKLIKSIETCFYSIDVSKIKFGDIVLFKPTISEHYHIAVIDESGKLSHHRTGKLPGAELFNDLMRKQVYKIYRYKDL